MQWCASVIMTQHSRNKRDPTSKIPDGWAGGMAQQLGALTALPEDPGSAPGTHMRLTTVHIFSFMRPYTIFWST